MDSNGNFTFSFMRSMNSSTFKPANTSVTVSAKATSSTPDKTYYIGLYDNSTGSQISYASFTANGTTYQYTFTGLSTSKQYYLRFWKPLSSSATITGSGKVSTIQ